MKQWRRAVLAALVATSMATGGPALANGKSGEHRPEDPPSQPTAPPAEDPTCESAAAEGDACPGDNGDGGGTATVPCTEGTELARDILTGGAEDGQQCPQ